MLAVGYSVRYLLPDSVIAYIARHKLFLNSGAADTRSSLPESPGAVPAGKAGASAAGAGAGAGAGAREETKTVAIRAKL